MTSEDLGLKIGTKEETAWKELKQRMEESLKQMSREMLINERIIRLCDEMISIEKDKLK